MGREFDDRLASLLRSFHERGDETAMEEFVALTRRRLAAAAARIVRPADAEDVVQAAYHSLIRKGPDLGGAPPFAWLLTAVVRIAYRRRAKNIAERAIVERLSRPPGKDDPARLAAGAEAAAILRGAIDRLPAIYRDALVLHHLAGLSTAETAKLLDVPPSTVTTRLARGRALLRSRLSPALLGWLVAGTVLLKGGVVKAKTAAAGVLAVVAAGAVTIGTIEMVRDRPADPAPAAPIRAADASGDGSPGAPPPLLTAAPVEAESPSAPPPVPADEASPGPALAALDPVAAAAAKAAHELLGERAKGREPDPAEVRRALDALAATGDRGFEAILALLRNGENGTWFKDLFAAVRAPGQERRALELVDDERVPEFSRWSLIESLPQWDVPEVRDRLAARAATETDPGLYMCTMQALADLREPRGARGAADRLFREGWSGVRSHVVEALGRMGGADAENELVALLRRPEMTADEAETSRFREATLRALRRLNPSAADAHAALFR